MDNHNKLHLVAADMGYGHQRAIYPLIKYSLEGPINLNDYLEIEEWEKNYWLKSKKAYEKISYFKKVPLFGSLVFKAMDYFQRIDKFYPHRKLEKQSLQQKIFFKAVKKGVGKKLIEKLNKNPIPFLTSFFVAAYAAEYYQYEGDIYCIVCDADISRAWAPINPKESKIKYLVPNNRGGQRLMMYGVREENIIVTGFPLPLENIGEDDKDLIYNLVKRLSKLDQKEIINKKVLLKNFEEYKFEHQSKNTINLTFAVGGAGAQREIGAIIVEKLKSDIENERVKLNLVAGSRLDVYNYFEEILKKIKLQNHPNIKIIYHPQKMEYFRLFNICLRETDVLWTKPSELSFYAGLGLPIIISDPLGSQEIFNREWLLSIGAGIDSLNPMYVNEWLFDWIEDGRLAKAALNAYLYAGHQGTEKVYKEVFKNN